MHMSLRKLWEIVKDRGAWLVVPMELQRVGKDLANNWASPVAQMVKNQPSLQGPGSDPWVGETYPGEMDSHPLQYSCLENFMVTWRATVHGVANSQT